MSTATIYDILAGATTGTALRTSDGFGISGYDYVSVSYPSGTQEVYTFKSGGSVGTTIGTLTINYTDSTKASLSSVVKT